MKQYRAAQARRAGGFTLVELLVVMAILALLAGLVGPSIMKQFGASKGKTAALQIKNFEGSLDTYKLDVGNYPTTEEGLQALVVKPASAKTWNGPYVQGGTVPLDPWQHPYKYAYSGSGEVEITSLGADGAPGGDGDNADITNKKQQ